MLSWSDVALASLPPVNRSTLVNTETGERLGTIEENEDGAWKVITEGHVLYGSVFCCKRVAKAAMEDVSGIDRGLVSRW